jgi:hypothetical protein
MCLHNSNFSHARRACVSAGASDLFGTAPGCARIVCHLGQIYRSQLAARRCGRNHPGNVLYLGQICATTDRRFDTVQRQPLQGFSGIKAVEDGSFWVMTDNGFGAKKDSADALLMFHRIKPD